YILGQYKFLSGTLTTFTTALVAVLGGGSFVSLLAPGATILTFGVGALVGLFSISYAIRWALSHYREATLTFLVSLMVGALRLPALKVLRHTPDVTPMAIGSVLAVAIVGGALVLLVDWFTDDIEFA
ncbi:MAG TPA: DUF368 domain-containing protein, partial [Halococcus sp.]|nr:DUF368 domain-containing protein [Halococcus sp.]